MAPCSAAWGEQAENGLPARESCAMIACNATYGCGDTMKKTMAVLSAVCLALPALVGAAAAGTETITFPGCSTSMTFQFAPFWDQWRRDDVTRERLAAGPANQHDYVRIFVVETGDEQYRPIVSFSTLGPLRNIQGKITPVAFEDMAARLDDVMYLALEESRRYAADFMDRQAQGRPQRFDGAARKVLFLGKKRKDSMFSFYTISMQAADERSGSYFRAHHYYYQNGCVACVTVMLPVAKMASREALGLLDSITVVEEGSALPPEAKEIQVNPDIDAFLRYHDDVQGRARPD